MLAFQKAGRCSMTASSIVGDRCWYVFHFSATELRYWTSMLLPPMFKKLSSPPTQKGRSVALLLLMGSSCRSSKHGSNNLTLATFIGKMNGGFSTFGV